MISRSFLAASLVTVLAIAGWNMTIAKERVENASPANLLHGDTGFELGMVGWHAFVGPWRGIELTNDYFPRRYKEDGGSSLDSSVGFGGNQSVRVSMRPNQRAYLTATESVGIAKGTYVFSVYARCSVPTNIDLRVITEAEEKPAYQQADFYAAAARTSQQVANTWTRVSLGFTLGDDKTILPIVDVKGSNGSCWFDNLMLNAGTQATPYQPASDIVVELAPEGPFPSPMPGLYFSKRPTGVKAQVSLSVRSESFRGQASAVVTTIDPEGTRRQLPGFDLDLSPQTKQRKSISLELPHTG
ncbi:MAG TPA: hypothetical protein PK437_09840, partial [Thiobacillaceae bacterium]|nr:hypothetical protein [Thiobacillaceae bacterium]